MYVEDDHKPYMVAILVCNLDNYLIVNKSMLPLLADYAEV